MPLQLPNIYASKNLKVLAIIPIVLMLIGIYLSTQIVLDSSLQGGISITLQTNSTMAPSQISGAISAALHTPSPSVQSSPGGVSITLISNSSLASAQDYLIAMYAFQSNYSAWELNATSYEVGLESQPTNQTLLSELAFANRSAVVAVAGMQSQMGGEMSALKPFEPNAAFSSSDPAAIASYAQGLYSNASNVYQSRVISSLHDILPFSSYSYQEVSPTLGRYFLSQLRFIIIVAFILISIIVFFIFRSPVVSLALVFGAANDIIIALGAMGLFKIPLGLASIGGLLMLIGYSIDTEILTSIRILKRNEGSPEDRAYGAMKTGLTMTSTAIVSFGVLFAVSILTYVPTYYQIASVVLFGLVGDIFTTWFGNTAMILMYKQRKDRV